MSTIGSTGATQIQRSRRTSQRGQVVDVYEMPPSAMVDFVGTFTIGTSVVGSLVLAEIDQRLQRGKGTVSLTYVSPSDFTIRYGGTDSPVYESDTNATETPIWQHPLIDNGDGWKAEPPENPSINLEEKSGNLQAYLTPAPTWTKMTVVNASTLSEADVVAGVGKIEVPSGLGSPTAGRWLKVGKSTSNDGDKITIRETWQYNPEGLWDTDVYPA